MRDLINRSTIDEKSFKDFEKKLSILSMIYSFG